MEDSAEATYQHPNFRRVVVGAFVLVVGFLAADAFIKQDDLVPAARWFLLGVAILSALYWVWTLPTMTPLLPKIVSVPSSASLGPGLQLQRPEGSGKRQLRARTLKLAARVHTYLADQPPDNRIEDWREMLGEQRDASSEAQRDAIWLAYNKSEQDAYLRTSQRITAEFGGEFRYLLSEYVRRGLIDENQVSLLEWKSASSYWMAQAAAELEALAHAL